MAVVIQEKSFESDTLADLDLQVNTFLATLAERNVLDVVVNTGRAGRYGNQNSFIATVVFKATIP